VTGQPVELDPSSNRFLTDFEKIKADFMERYEKGEVGSFEKWDSNGNLVAGAIYERVGNLIYPDTVVYRRDFGANINDAREVFVHLADDLINAGIPLVDIVMVTPFSQSIKGREITAAEFEELAMPLRFQTPTALVGPSEWIPAAANPKK
jgi:Leu/Phe-tRNA-protein transferase